MTSPAGLIDSRLFRDQFGTPEMRAVFSDDAMLRTWAKVEAALAGAQAELGMVPPEVAAEIGRAAEAFGVGDYEPLRQRLADSGHPLIPFLDEFGRRLSTDAAGWLHWGATTQDITDTAIVLMLRDAFGLIGDELAVLAGAVEDLARRHRDTPMSGRTHGQHAVPITFGLKAAVMLDELRRHRHRLDEIGPRVLVGQLGGAAGTMASFGDRGLELLELFCRRLGLGAPTAPWHIARDRLAEAGFAMAAVTATCGRLAREVIELQRTEIAEAAEPSTDRSVGSSTMPQKANPMMAEVVVALARAARQHPAVLLEAMGGSHERDMSTWAAEWLALSETAILASGALRHTGRIYASLAIDPDRMAANLGLTAGSINAERVMMALAPALGRARAHELVTELVRSARASGRTFEQTLADDETAANLLTADERADLLRPESYLGLSGHIVDQVLSIASVQSSQRVVITKHGNPVAEVVPFRGRSGIDFDKLAEDIRQLGIEASFEEWPDEFNDPAFSRQVLGLE